MHRKVISGLLLIIFSNVWYVHAQDQHSVARQWNEVLLEAIRADFARPTVHARNLFHTSIALYDAWAAYDDVARPFLLGRTVDSYTCDFSGIARPEDRKAAREEAMSYAAYRLLRHRFASSPGMAGAYQRFDALFASLGYNASFTSIDYTSGNPASLGNYIAEKLIEFGMQDGANEQNSYANHHYATINPPLVPFLSGNPEIIDPNRWQPLRLEFFIDQGGIPIDNNTPPFLSPEWGEVTPFALTEADRTIYECESGQHWVYHDPGSPPYLDVHKNGGLSEEYKWNFALVAIWSCHLAPTDKVMWDISPASQGNIQKYPESMAEYHDFYNLIEGGDTGKGHAINPHTGQPYEPQWVPRGDYTRALAEFWADGPASETPPGHWFTVLNYVSDHPALKKQFEGEGPIVDDLEWDVKAYLALGGALHDAAVTAWGIKGWYDYVRPISAIRVMADNGQSSDPALPHYSPGGFPLVPGYIEIVQAGDALAGVNGENIGKVKVHSWKGPGYIADPVKDEAGVDWILAENWWPYQRPSFVTPPFAGYISGHSTFSRAAAEVLTLLTGDPYFPGGMGEFPVKKNEFLVFEKGPSVDLTLQWATYRDASDQTSLSRIWGGIHPPADDMPGRHIGEKIGKNAFAYAKQFFSGETPDIVENPAAPVPVVKVYPNPLSMGETLKIALNRPVAEPSLLLEVFNAQGTRISSYALSGPNQRYFELSLDQLATGLYWIRLTGDQCRSSHRVMVYH
jgi:hypothetical protein